MLRFLLTAAETSGAADQVVEGGLWVTLINLLSMILVFVIFYFLLIRPQRKKDKEIQKMRQNLEVGDEVVTAGGIIGRVVSLREDNVVIESGSDRSKVRIARWAIQENRTIHDETAQ